MRFFLKTKIDSGQTATIYNHALIIKDDFTGLLQLLLTQVWLVDYSLHHIYRSFDEDGVVSDVVPLLHLLVRDKLGVAESQHTLVQKAGTYAPDCSRSRSLEVLPVGIWAEAFGDVLRFGQCWVALVQQREGDAVRERPLQQAVVLTREHSDIDGEVCSFAAAVPVRKEGHLETVSIAMRVENGAEKL